MGSPREPVASSSESTQSRKALRSTATVTSDGLGCFAAVIEAGCVHMPNVVGALKSGDLPEFKWINTIPGNLKTALASSPKALNHCQNASIPASFAYRLNRRFELCDLVPHLVIDVAQTLPVPRKVVMSGHAEARFLKMSVHDVITTLGGVVFDAAGR